MTLSQLLTELPAILIVAAAILGLCVGSFLNVVVYRLPIMQQRAMREWALHVTSDGNATSESEEAFNLSKPRSHCPSCKTPIAWWANIPLFSYLGLRGRCHRCKVKISPRYPMVEVVSALLSALLAWKFGFGWDLLGALVLSWGLFTLSLIDIDTQTLPDSITLPWIWLGLLASIFLSFSNPTAAILGAILGYGFLWSVYWAFKLLTGKEGMGYGDFKLLAMLGAWLGWQQIPMIILLSSLVGAVTGVALIATGKLRRDKPMPFGPFLAAAGWLALFAGDEINQTYLRLTGIGG